MEQTQLQVVARYLANGSGFPVSVADIHTGSWQAVELYLPADATTEGLEIRPVDRPAVIEVSEISVRSDAGRILWMAKTVPDLQRVQTMGTLSLLPGKDRCLFFNFGDDPFWVLPPLVEHNTPVSLRAVLCVHEDFGAVTDAMATAHAQIYLMAAQVRSASADQNRTLREYQRRTEAAEAERGSALRKIQEQTLRIAQAQAQITEAQAQIAEAQAQNDSLALQLKELQAHHEKLRQQLLHMEGSRSWRVTRPLRSASILAQKLRKNPD